MGLSPTCSLPLKTYNLHPSTGFRASGGSLYFKTVLFFPSTLCTVFVSAASNPDGAKLGLALSSGEGDRDGEPDFIRRIEGGDAERLEGPA